MIARARFATSLTLIVVIWLLFPQPFLAIAQTKTSTSLRGKSDEELLHIMVGGKNERRLKEEREVEMHLPGRFWEMLPKDAALALIEKNYDAPTRQKLRFSFDTSDDAQPPSKGEIGLRWECSHCYLAERGLTILRYSGAKSSLSYSRIKLEGSTKKIAIQHAVDQTKSVPLREELARQIYETIWWLVRIRFSETQEAKGDIGVAERIISTGDGNARFWVSPGRRSIDVTLCAGLTDRYSVAFRRDRSLCDLPTNGSMKH